MIRRVLPLVGAVAFLFAGCGSDSPTSPTSPPAETRVIVLFGDMNFGIVEIGQSSERVLNVRNDGNAPLTITGITSTGSVAGAFQTSGASATIQAGATHGINIRFSPTEPREYAGTLAVTANQTAGTNTHTFSGMGTGPLYTNAGTGDTVFDLPAYISRLRITGQYTRNSSNFVVRVNGRLIVNELLGTGWGATTFEGTYQLTPTGGTVQITNSSGVAWTFTEVR